MGSINNAKHLFRDTTGGGTDTEFGPGDWNIPIEAQLFILLIKYQKNKNKNVLVALDSNEFTICLEPKKYIQYFQ